MVEHVSTLLQIVYGDIKTAKTSYGLTSPWPVALFDFDQSFVRAQARYEALNPGVRILVVGPEYDTATYQSWLMSEAPNYDIIVRVYRMPQVMPGLAVTGSKELFEESITPDIQAVYQKADHIRSVVYDTGSVLWEILMSAQLQRAQDRNPGRERLGQIEYARPNTEMRSLIDSARFTHKNLTIIGHTGPRYGSGYVTNAKGQKELKFNTVIGEMYKGFKETGNLVDVVSRMRLYRWCGLCNDYYEHGPLGEVSHNSHLEQVGPGFYPRLEIEDCGYSLNAKGTLLDVSTFDNMLGVINTLRMEGF